MQHLALENDRLPFAKRNAHAGVSSAAFLTAARER